jgi:uncharacterized protein YodC (DUF2158 family)
MKGFRVGNIVRLKSGGPLMVVAIETTKNLKDRFGNDAEALCCMWFDIRNRIRSGNFHPDTIILVQEHTVEGERMKFVQLLYMSFGTFGAVWALDDDGGIWEYQQDDEFWQRLSIEKREKREDRVPGEADKDPRIEGAEKFRAYAIEHLRRLQNDSSARPTEAARTIMRGLTGEIECLDILEALGLK